MYMKKQIIFLCFTLLLVSCKTDKKITSGTQAGDGRYDSEFPDITVSDQLEEISKTVKKIDCLAFYMTYTFPKDNTIQVDSLTDHDLKKKSSGSAIINKSVSGTVTLTYYDGKTVGMLTCAHVVDFADTIYNWYDENKTKLHSVSIKLRQQNYVAGLPAGNTIEVVATDKKNDIAILRKELAHHVEKPQILNFGVGASKDLEWGTFVYIMGYPLGNLMVTRALVSNPGKTKGNVFLTDALYNRGISGSPVFALRDGSPHFEWVGMAKSASVDNIVYLAPDEEHLDAIDTEQPFNDTQYVKQNVRINYGITYSVTIDAILRFFTTNKEKLEKAGIYIKQ